MTVFLQRPSQQYAARPGNPYKVSATIPAQAVVNRVRVTLTREGWPAGEAVAVELSGPDGVIGASTFAGGDLKLRDGTVLAASVGEFAKAQADPGGAQIPMPFAAGQYTLSFTALQPVTTAVTVEYF